jgi:hypothetical protein
MIFEYQNAKNMLTELTAAEVVKIANQKGGSLISVSS